MEQLEVRNVLEFIKDKTKKVEQKDEFYSEDKVINDFIILSQELIEQVFIQIGNLLEPNSNLIVFKCNGKKNLCKVNCSLQRVYMFHKQKYRNSSQKKFDNQKLYFIRNYAPRQ